MLTGIALVVEDVHKGHKLAFKYPVPDFSQECQVHSPSTGGDCSDRCTHAAPNSMKLPLKTTNFGMPNRLGKSTVVQIQSLTENSRKPDSSIDELQAHRRVWRFDPELLPKLFRPKPAQCGKVLEVYLDELLFLAFPMQVNRAINRSDNCPEDDRVASVDKDTYSTSASMESSAVNLSSDHIEQENVNSDEAEIHQELTMFCVIFILDMDCALFDEGSRLNLSSKCGSSEYGIPYPGSKEIVGLLRSAGVQLATGMLVEEHRCGYVSEQVHSILTTNRMVLDPGSGKKFDGSSSRDNFGHLDVKEGGSVSTKPMSKNKTYEKMESNSVAEFNDWAMHRVFETCDLARALRDAFWGLLDSKQVNVLLNNRVRVSFSPSCPLLHPTQPLRPYHSLLILDGETLNSDNLKTVFSVTHLDQFARFATFYGPLKSFNDMSDSLGIPLEEVFRMAAYLVFWRKGKIVNCLQPTDIYRISPSADLNPLSPLHYEFYKKFACKLDMNVYGRYSFRDAQTQSGKIQLAAGRSLEFVNDNGSESMTVSGSQDYENVSQQSWTPRVVLSLTQILELFSKASVHSPRNFAEVADDARVRYRIQKDEFNSIFCWLLKCGLIVELCRYYYLFPRSHLTLVSLKKVAAGDLRPVGGPGGPRSEAHAAKAEHLLAVEVAQVSEIQASLAALEDPGAQAIHAEHSTYTSQPPSASSATNVSSNSNLVTTHGKARPAEEVMDGLCINPRRNLYTDESDVGQDQGRARKNKAFLDSIAADTDAYRLLRRLAPYFHGRHHSREITWREDLPLEGLNKLVQVYSNFLFSYLAYDEQCCR